jgi:hypothetical protein
MYQALPLAAEGFELLVRQVDLSVSKCHTTKYNNV